MHMPEGFSAPSDLPAARRRMLLVFDGGNAPGYSSAAVALVEEGERRGYEMWAATEGFRSLTSDRVAEPAFERLIVSRVSSSPKPPQSGETRRHRHFAASAARRLTGSLPSNRSQSAGCGLCG